MIEIFKTNIGDAEQARLVAREIRERFSHYSVNFDLDDCDRIMRVKCDLEHIDTANISTILAKLGINAEVLPDVVPERRDLPT